MMEGVSIYIAVHLPPPLDLSKVNIFPASMEIS